MELEVASFRGVDTMYTLLVRWKKKGREGSVSILRIEEVTSLHWEGCPHMF